jgi:hypothetical protein
MKARVSQVKPGDTTAVFYADNLVLTVEHKPGRGYEVLVEMDTDDYAAGTSVEIGNAVGDSVEWDL